MIYLKLIIIYYNSINLKTMENLLDKEVAFIHDKFEDIYIFASFIFSNNYSSIELNFQIKYYQDKYGTDFLDSTICFEKTNISLKELIEIYSSNIYGT